MIEMIAIAAKLRYIPVFHLDKTYSLEQPEINE